MSDREARLRLPIDCGPGAEIEIEGRQMTGVRSIALRAGVGQITTLEVEMVLGKILAEGRWRIAVSPSAREDLIALGWTPPAGEA